MKRVAFCFGVVLLLAAQSAAALELVYDQPRGRMVEGQYFSFLPKFVGAQGKVTCSTEGTPQWMRLYANCRAVGTPPAPGGAGVSTITITYSDGVEEKSVSWTLEVFPEANAYATPTDTGMASPPVWRFDDQPIDPPDSDIVRTYTEVATLVIPVGKGHKLCWSNPNVLADGTEDTNMTLGWRRYRVEGGSMYESQALPHSAWGPSANGGERSYCNDAGVINMSGHWVYEAQMCYADTQECSAWVTSVKPSEVDTSPSAPDGTGAGSVDGRPKGWWVYAYLSSPTNPEITQIPIPDDGAPALANTQETFAHAKYR